MTYRLLLVPAKLLFVAGVLLAVSSAVAQESDGPSLRIDSLNHDSYPALEATATVLDSSEVPIAGVPAEAFAAYLGGVSLSVSSVIEASDEAAGISVVLVFDVSGSMAGLPLQTAQVAGKALIGQLHPNDLVAVVAFGDAVRVVQPFTNDRTALATSIDGLAPAGNTSLYEAVARSVELAAAAETPRRAVVLLSDGTDFGGLSTSSREQSLSIAAGSGAPVFVTGLGDSIDSSYLEEVAIVSGGELSIAPTPASLESLYQRIGGLLRHQYLITLNASELEAAGTQPLRLEATIDGTVVSAERSIQLPAPVPGPVEVAPEAPPAEPVVPVEPPAVVAEEPPVAEEASGSLGSLVLIAVPVLAVAGVVTALLVLWRRRRRNSRRGDVFEEADASILHRFTVSQSSKGAAPEPPTHPVVRNLHEVGAWLSVPENGRERSHAIDGAPVTIGFSSDCDVVLPNGNAPGPERVRVWRRDGRFMLHNLSYGGAVRVAGKPVSWVVLENGDEIEIGGSTVTFQASQEPDRNF